MTRKPKTVRIGGTLKLSSRGKAKLAERPDMEPDWEGECANCGASPIVPATGLCGPCTFGDSETIGGNW